MKFLVPKREPRRYAVARKQNYRREVHALILYRSLGTWAYDDERMGIKEEFFVAGADLMLDEIRCAFLDDDDPYGPFRLTFSASPLPDAWEATFARKGNRQSKGAYYTIKPPDFEPMEGWLCGRLLDYFPRPPKTIWVRADPLAADAVVPTSIWASVNVDGNGDQGMHGDALRETIVEAEQQ